METETMREWEHVTRDEFYKIIYDNNLDVIPTPIGEYPYTTLWKTRAGDVWAKVIGSFIKGTSREKRDFFIKKGDDDENRTN